MARRVPPPLSIVLALLSFGVAAVPASGLVLATDVVGRVLFTVVWILVGVAWLGQLLHARARPNG